MAAAGRKRARPPTEPVMGVAMLARIHSAAILGVDAYPVQVEVDVSFGERGMTIVGLPDVAVRESVQRVEAPASASPSTSRPPTSARRAPSSTCPSRWASSSPPARPPRTMSSTRWR